MIFKKIKAYLIHLYSTFLPNGDTNVVKRYWYNLATSFIFTATLKLLLYLNKSFNSFRMFQSVPYAGKGGWQKGISIVPFENYLVKDSIHLGSIGPTVALISA